MVRLVAPFGEHSFSQSLAITTPRYVFVPTIVDTAVKRKTVGDKNTQTELRTSR